MKNQLNTGWLRAEQWALLGVLSRVRIHLQLLTPADGHTEQAIGSHAALDLDSQTQKVFPNISQKDFA